MPIHWRLVAQARGLDIPEADLDRIVPVLESLEAVFRPMLATLTYATEPAVILSDQAVAGE